MRKEKLIGRLRQLSLLEFINMFLLPAGFLAKCYFSHEAVGPNLIVAMLFNSFLLLEGSYLWFNISQRLRFETTFNPAKIFKILRPINIALIISAILFILYYPFQGNWDKYGAIGFLSLAILEHINYFEYQLMYDNKNDLNHLIRFGFKKSKLKRLLEASNF